MTVGKSPKPAKRCRKRSKALSILASPPIDLNGRGSLSTREVAQFHGVSERTVFSWQRQGILKGRKHGQILRFDIEHVRAMFQPESEGGE